MTPVVSIIMGSTSDLPVMEKAAKFLDEMEIPFEMHALSAHRTPAEVEAFAKGAKGRGIKVIIAAAGMAAHLCGVIASMTTVPVIGVPINSTLDGMDAYVCSCRREAMTRIRFRAVMTAHVPGMLMPERTLQVRLYGNFLKNCQLRLVRMSLNSFLSSV